MKTRELALDALVKIEQQGAYSNLLLRQMLDKQALDSRDAALLTEIVYGTVQRQLTIDHVLNTLIERGISSFSPWLRACLRLSLYQMLFLDRVPDHAIVNTAVQIAKKRGHLGIAKLVNGVLRNAIRRKSEWLNGSIHKNAAERISHLYSYPLWLVAMWLAQYGESVTEQICAAQLRPAKTSVRVNQMKTNRDAMLKQMQDRSLHATASCLSNDGIVIERAGNLADSDWFRNGWCTIQDESSMMVAEALDASQSMKVLDCCAAPGGKTTHIAEKMKDKGAVVAVDVHPHKKNLIADQTKRLRLSSVETVTADATKLRDRFKDQTFDRILLDAPCSGFGVIRRKPDLKWRKTEADLQAIVKLQQTLLESVAPLLKSGGILVYSTCTLNRAENEQVIANFLRKHPHFLASPDFPSSFPEALRNNVDKTLGCIKILPHEYDSDGFFIARLRRI